jgi:hypothetical protein
MLRCSKWLVLLALVLALVSTFLLGSPQAFASTHQLTGGHTQTQAGKPLISVCSFNGGNYGAVVDYNNYNNQVYFCGTGYTGTWINHVNQVYNNSGFSMWIRWYQGGPGHYCTIGINNWASWSGNTPVLITQVDIDGTNGPTCP